MGAASRVGTALICGASQGASQSAYRSIYKRSDASNGSHENLYVKNMHTLSDPTVRNAVLLRLSRLQQKTEPLWGRMTAHQMLCHLCDSFKVPMGEKQASAATGPLQRSIVKWIALYLPIHWPKGVPTRPEIEQGIGGTAPMDFDCDLRELRSIIERFTTRAPAFSFAPHPFFGEMSFSEWTRWGYLHTDHHLRQFGV